MMVPGQILGLDTQHVLYIIVGWFIGWRMMTGLIRFLTGHGLKRSWRWFTEEWALSFCVWPFVALFFLSASLCAIVGLIVGIRGQREKAGHGDKGGEEHGEHMSSTAPRDRR